MNWLGIAILLIGLAWSSGAYLMGENRMTRQSTDQQAVDNVSRDDTLSFEDSKTSSRGTEIYLGKVGVLLSTWFHRWEGLEDFQRSAIVIATSCVLAGFDLFSGRPSRAITDLFGFKGENVAAGRQPPDRFIVA
jgi:hypothetical protein